MQLTRLMDYDFRGIRLGRMVIGSGVAIIQILLYQVLMIFNMERLTAHTPVWDIALPLDSMIPLIPESAWIYFLYIPSLIIPALMDIPLQRFLRYALSLALAASLSSVLFALLPLRIFFEPYQCLELSCIALDVLRSADAGVNIFPSLHASQCLLACIILFNSRDYLANKSIPWLLTLLIYLPIVLSTLLTKQHFLIDLPAGFLMAIFCWFLAGKLIKDQNEY